MNSLLNDDTENCCEECTKNIMFTTAISVLSDLVRKGIVLQNIAEDILMEYEKTKRYSAPNFKKVDGKYKYKS